MRVRVEIENYDAKAKQFGAAFDAAITQALMNTAVLTEEYLRSVSPVATGAFKTAWSVKLLKGRGRVPTIAVTNTDPGAMAIEYGRRPGGKAPPPQEIAKWALAKGIISEIPDYTGKKVASNDGTKGVLRGDVRVGRKRREIAKERAPRRFVSKRERGVMGPGEARKTVYVITRVIQRHGITGKHILKNSRAEIARILRAQVVAAISAFGLGRRVVSTRGGR